MKNKELVFRKCMEYRFLGNSGLRVSELSLGPWLTISKHLSVKQTKSIIHHAIDSGVNFFDNAERYAEGMAEAVLGQVFKHHERESLVIATKIFWGGDGVNNTGLSRKHLVEGTKNSLRRLQLDYVDVLFCHRPDCNTPMEEIVVTMDMLIQQGYALYWGTSEWTVSAIHEARRMAVALNCIPPIVEQSEYNIFVRQRVEDEYVPLYEKYHMGVTVYSPLASGILTGKYIQGLEDDFRLTHQKRLWTEDFDDRLQIAKEIAEVAHSLSVKPAQLALAWCLRKPYVSSVIMGASNHEQLSENVAATRIKDKLTTEVLEKIDLLCNKKTKQVEM